MKDRSDEIRDSFYVRSQRFLIAFQEPMRAAAIEILWQRQTMYVSVFRYTFSFSPKELKYEDFSLYPLLSQIMVVANSHAFCNTGKKETRNTKSIKFKLRILCPKALILCIFVLWRELDCHFLLLVMVLNNRLSFTQISFTFTQEEWN